MAEIPDTIVLKRDRDLAGRRRDIWIRRGLLGLIAVVPVLALLNVFGQRAQTTTRTADAAALKLYAPPRVRSGLLYEARFRVTARHELKQATLMLSPGWFEGMTVNTVEPSPVGEGSTDGKPTFELGHIAAGRSFLLFVQFQVNPVNVGRHDQTVWLYDGPRRLLTLHRTITVFP